MIIGPYTVSRGTLVPYEMYSQSQQARIELMDGAVCVAEDVDAQFMKATFRVPLEEAMNIQGYLRNSVRYSAEAFTITDDFGASWSVRYWDSKIGATVIGGSITEMVCLFRVEVT